MMWANGPWFPDALERLHTSRYTSNMPIKTISKGFKILWIVLFAIIGAVVGAILIGGFSSIALSILGAVIGLVVGGLFGRYVPWYEWFVN